MSSSRQTPKDKGKGPAKPVDDYRQAMLENLNFRPTAAVDTPVLERLYFEALDYARGNLGPNFFLSPALRHSQNQTPQYNIQKDTDKIIFCDHCSTMTEAFKRLNQTKEELQRQNIHLLEKVTELELKLRQSSIRQQTQSSPSPSKMDETGVHSLLKAKKSIVPDMGTTSPVQTVASKDLPNPIMAFTLPKSEEEPRVSYQTKYNNAKATDENEDAKAADRGKDKVD
ncbi:hypothetical protein RND71_030325 [Anisodus tanguticus]|uniref:Uncharacterized protein n=1 Tax=Anisodus tanguticus TaxID=243964 RepID=A0AAE1RHJ6_9SOLA|nr:hypothetical protein RND71_030325 [Anisodus tanguticus]